MVITKYSVIVLSANSTDAQGKALIEQCCGHKHRTINAAVYCLDKLTASRDGHRPAKWHRAQVLQSDGQRLSDSDQAELDQFSL